MTRITKTAVCMPSFVALDLSAGALEVKGLFVQALGRVTPHAEKRNRTIHVLYNVYYVFRNFYN